ncbi:MAG: type II secretion system minor pseudopilin GspK [Deltaproteobacteria bacterium]|nr:type II secretion system minor pseudopilin GspK [Deltaproteobacteria bacterium]
MALVLTLLILTLLVVAGLEFHRLTRVEASLAGNFRDLTQASYIGRSGVEVARALFQEDDPSYDGPDERWAQFEVLSALSGQFFPEGYFMGRIVDESAKFNPNSLINSLGGVDEKKRKQLERLLFLLGHGPETVDALLDWLDGDDQKRPWGAERDFYLARKRPYPPKNGPLDSLGEMARIKGIEASFLYGTEGREGVRNFLTVFSEGQININTASLPVLMSLSPKIDETLARAVLEFRQQKSFRRAEELRGLPGWGEIFPEISREVTVRSNYFSIEAVGSYREAQATVRAVIRREGRGTRVIYWKAE